jgi:WD40 repeat protein/tRNA A-37 threonylcarbamoyl transferase component Bud32
MNPTVSETTPRDERLDEVLAAYLEAVDAGWAPHPDEFLARYPALRRDLEAFFAAQDEVHSCAQHFRSDDPAGKNRTPSGEATSGLDQPGGESSEKLSSFGDYEVLEEIARGGMGVVYKARQISLNRVVALKMILSGQLASAADVQRFRNEAEAAALMDHPNIVPIYEVGEHQGQHYFTMKLIEGDSLAQKVARRAAESAAPDSLRLCAQLMARVARAVHYAHQRGILHRDLKPANILLDADGQPHVTDFGLAKRLTIPGDANLTQSGALVGTPNYMAPEQARGESKGLTTAADVHSLGAILYELLAGRPPFHADNVLDTLLQVREQKPVSPRALNPHIDADLATICLKCLEKEPARRYESAAALGDDLERWLAGEVILARRTSLWVRLLKWARRRPALAGVAVLVVLTVLLVLVGLGTLMQLHETQSQRDIAEDLGEQYRQQRDRAETAHQEAQQLRQRVETEKRRVEEALYANGIARAQLLAWLSDDVAADQVLNECPEHLRHWEWHHIKRLCHSDQLTLRGHISGVFGLCFSPDGKQIATSRSSRVTVWDARSGEEINTLVGHNGKVENLVFSPDGKRLASASADQTVKVWDVRTGKEVFTLKGHAGIVWDVAFGPNGKLLGSASSDRTVKVWDANSGQELFALQGQSEFNSVAFSGDGKYLAASTSVGRVQVWDASTRTKGHTLHGHSGKVFRVAFSSNGQHLASAGQDGTVKVWAVSTGEETLSLKGHTGTVRDVAFSPDGKRIASAGEDKTVRIWDAATGQESLTTKMHTDGVTRVAFSPDGERLASGSDDQTVKVWDAHTGQGNFSLNGHTGAVVSVCFSPDGKRLASSSGGFDAQFNPLPGEVKVWDAVTGRDLLTLKGHTHPVWHVCFSPDGKRLASASWDQTVKVWDAVTGCDLLTLKGHTRPVLHVCFSPDGKRLASASLDRTVRLWDAVAGRNLLTLKRDVGTLGLMCFSPDGLRLAGVGGDGAVRVWDAVTGRELLTLKGHPLVHSVCFSPDGKRLAGLDLFAVRIWEVATGRELLTFSDTAGSCCVCFSPDGKRLASANMDEPVTIWDAATGRDLLTLVGHHGRRLRGQSGGINSICFSPDGKRLATANEDKTVEIWDATPLAAKSGPARHVPKK